MNLDDDSDVNIFDIDWVLLSESDKSAIITEHVRYINLSRKAVHATGSYLSNIRSLILMMTICLIMSLLDLENKTIILFLIGSQFFKSLISKLAESDLYTSADDAKNELSEFMQRMIRKSKNA